MFKITVQQTNTFYGCRLMVLNAPCVNLTLTQIRGKIVTKHCVKYVNEPTICEILLFQMALFEKCVFHSSIFPSDTHFMSGFTYVKLNFGDKLKQQL